MTSPNTIHLAHSPDSDDAFMFYALADGQIDTQGISYVHELQDIETLNGRAMRGELDVTAVSIHAYAYLSDRYALLPHGASMGDWLRTHASRKATDDWQRHRGQASRGAGNDDERLSGAPTISAGFHSRRGSLRSNRTSRSSR